MIQLKNICHIIVGTATCFFLAAPAFAAYTCTMDVTTGSVADHGNRTSYHIVRPLSGVQPHFGSGAGTYGGYVTSTWGYLDNVSTNDPGGLTNVIVTLIGTIHGGSTESTPVSQLDVPGKLTWSVNFLYDSTHFRDGSRISIQTEAWSKNGGHALVTTYTIARNKCYAIGNQEVNLFGAVDSVNDQADLMNHGRLLPSRLDDTPTILAQLPKFTVFYIATHGNISAFADCVFYDSIPNRQFHKVQAKDKTGGPSVSLSIASKKANQPPYNLVFLDACQVAGIAGGPLVTTFSDAFQITSSSSNQVFMGWRNECMVWEMNKDWTSRFWTNLADGKTVRWALIQANASGYKQGFRTFPPIEGDVISIQPQFIGDHATKIHGVYQGKDLQWTKVLSSG